MENSMLSETKSSIDDSAVGVAEATEPQLRLVDVPVNNENDALRCLVSFLNLAQRRGVFAIDESSKIWDCIQMFQSTAGASETGASETGASETGAGAGARNVAEV
jgi:hypothetical protein